MNVKIKICGLFRLEDAQAVNAALPDYAGLVFCESSRRYVTPVLARELRAALSRDIRTVGVFVNAPIDRIEELYSEGILSIAQLHGSEDTAYVEALRTLLPALDLWQAFKVADEPSLAKAARSKADRVLLDGGAGGGKAFSWALADGFPRPFILAGGLTPETIPAAIARLHPFAVDVSSGVETDGVKDSRKIMAAVRAAREANA